MALTTLVDLSLCGRSVHQHLLFLARFDPLVSRLSPRPTTLVIAHRYSMVKDADFVIVLDEGRILEQGTPDELVAAGGWFAQLSTESEA